MIRAIVVDDEEFNLLEIEELIKAEGNLQIVGSFLNPFKAIEDLKLLNPDVAFLDIEMPGISGLELSGKLLEINPKLQIVFITAYDQYAVEAFEINVLDYVLKPIRRERLNKTIKRIINQNATTNEEIKVEEKWKVVCFNSLEVFYGKNKLKWKTEKEKMLFAYLFENLGKSIHKDKIIENLWFESHYKNNLIYLQTTVSRLRKSLKTLGGKFSIEYSSNCYQMILEDLYCDIFEFNKLIEECRTIDENKTPIMDRIITLYTGDYLAENYYEWSVPKEEMLRKTYMDLLMKFSKYLVKGEKYKTALRYLNILVEKQPYNEDANKMVFLIYHKLKDVYSMRKHYEKIEEILKNEYQLEISSRTKGFFTELQQEHQ